LDQAGKTILVIHEHRERPDDLLFAEEDLGPLGNQDWTLASMAIDYIAEVRKIPPVRAALELRNAMYRGEVKGRHGSRLFEPEFWRFIAPDVRGFVSGDLWIEVRAAEVLAAFPRRTPASHAPKLIERPKATDRAVREWIRARVAAWPDDQPAPCQVDDFAAASIKFDGLSREEFRLVRNEETPAAWRKQGPRRPWGVVKQICE
jgi:hypothetical protein